MNNNQPNKPINIIKNKTNQTAPPITISKTITTTNSKANTKANTKDNTLDSGWSTQSNKRIHSNSSNSLSEPSSPNSNMDINGKQKTYKKKVFASRNRFEPLAQDDPFDPPTTENISTNSQQNDAENDIMENENTPIKPPPPIFVKGVEDFPALCTELIELIGVDNFICKSSTNSLKIQTTDPNSYRVLERYLKAENAEYHTYQLKEEKPLRIVIRNLHPSTPLSLIKEELEVRLYEVRQVTNVLHKVNKNPLPLFFVDLEPTLKSNEIFKMSSLLHCKIKIEEPYKPKTISQCFNCQQYGHTRTYCGYQPRCVRCGADHQSTACPNSRDAPPKCAHCSQNHPANYKGCTIYKELQRRKNSSAPSNRLQNNFNVQTNNVQSSHPPVRTFPNHPSPQTQTYAQATSNTPDFAAPPPSTDTQPPDLSKLLTNFLDEFKNVINPLISLLTKQNDAENDIMENENTPIKPPPPIFVKGVEDFPALCTELIELIGVDNFICKSSTNSLKIQTTDPNSYRVLERYLKAENAEYHTYQLKEEKPLRIVIRNLHPSTPLSLIKEELEVRLYEVRQVTNVLHKVNKNPLPLFFVDLEPTLKSNEIFKMSSLLHCKIKIEEPYKPKTISQCFNCQQYGHTRTYCGYQPRCVRCGADHQSTACPNSRDAPPKCAHCSQNHPANYKGCTIYKELQRRKNSSAPSNRLQNNFNVQTNNVQSSHPPVRTFPNHPSPQTQTYAQATSNTPDFAAPPPSTDTQPPDLSKLLTNFLDEFKNVINPLISLLTKTAKASTII
ncbi:hypothetical protein AGLY_011065 [Aphis glycines]|uniref:Pre-C2HC domain-containing protein n=1 Tax=Aphis glycines TaxID=307491 RepID=A0A6G0TCD6_APHGL|nr:hypothetical protein AGLY_011065 [Aphis glycines]